MAANSKPWSTHDVMSTPADANDVKDVRVALDSYKEFNRAMLDFIRDLATSFPYVEGFRRAYASTNLMSTLNPTLVQSLFNRCVSPYIDHIMRRDDDFFLRKDYTQECSAAGESAEIVTILKDIWRTLSPQDKESIWKHFDVLVALNYQLQSKKVV
jgi:hypothetical protein